MTVNGKKVAGAPLRHSCKSYIYHISCLCQDLVPHCMPQHKHLQHKHFWHAGCYLLCLTLPHATSTVCVCEIEARMEKWLSMLIYSMKEQTESDKGFAGQLSQRVHQDHTH